jgi:prepilin-type processing-associated H-X9-DG protein
LPFTRTAAFVFWGFFDLGQIGGVVTLARLEDSAGTMVACDGRRNSYVVGYDANPYAWQGPEPWHNDGVNVIFADGHVKWWKTGPRPAVDDGRWHPFPAKWFTWAAD